MKNCVHVVDVDVVGLNILKYFYGDSFRVYIYLFLIFCCCSITYIYIYFALVIQPETKQNSFNNFRNLFSHFVIFQKGVDIKFFFYFC